MMCYIQTANGFLCGDNANCMCFKDQKAIFCGSVDSPTDIEFHKDMAMHYNSILVPNSFTCDDMIELRMRTGMYVYNSIPCALANSDVKRNNANSDVKQNVANSDVKQTDKTNTGMDESDMKHSGVSYKNHADISGKPLSDVKQHPNVVNMNNHDIIPYTSNEYATFDISFKVISFVIVILISLCGVKLHYNMRPFIKLLPKPYADLTGFFSYITRRKTDIPDVSRHFTVTFNTNEDEIYGGSMNHVSDSVHHSSKVEAGVVSSNSTVNASQKDSSTIVKEAPYGDSMTKSPIERLSPPIMTSTKISVPKKSVKKTPPHPPPPPVFNTNNVQQSEVVIEEGACGGVMSPPIMTSTRLYVDKKSSMKNTPPPFPLRVPKKLEEIINAETQLLTPQQKRNGELSINSHQEPAAVTCGIHPSTP